VQDRLPLFRIELGRLLREQLVEIGITAIGVGAALGRQDLEAGRRVAERAAAALPRSFFSP